MREAVEKSIGKRYDSVVVQSIYREERKNYARVMATCFCDCGNTKDIILQSLKSGVQTSCGCLKNKRIANLKKTHGFSGTRIHIVWKGMIARCNNPKHKSFNNYGGRGIKVSESWHNFINFFNDMGDPGTGLMLDRIDNNLGYSKENCRWTTNKENGRNKRNNSLFLLNGEERPLSYWCEKFGVEHSLVRYRVFKMGLDFHTALTAKIRRKNGQGRQVDSIG